MDPHHRVFQSGAPGRWLTVRGSHYGSGKLFRFLGPHLVNDHLHLNVKIHEERSGATPSPLS